MDCASGSRGKPEVHSENSLVGIAYHLYSYQGQERETCDQEKAYQEKHFLRPFQEPSEHMPVRISKSFEIFIPSFRPRPFLFASEKSGRKHRCHRESDGEGEQGSIYLYHAEFLEELSDYAGHEDYRKEDHHVCEHG